MLKSEIRYTDDWHVRMLVVDISEESARGLRVLGLDPLNTIRSSILASSKVRTIITYNKVAAIFGVVPRDGYGQIWFNTSREVLKHPREFFKETKAVFTDLQDGFKVMMNTAYVENVLTLNLAEHFGFKIIDTHPRGLNGELFHLLRWEAPDVHRG